jgi:peptidoglycan/xylan/chitin deacetylase (PgdA/CDA1 family)
VKPLAPLLRVCLCALLSSLGLASADARPTVIVTVDVESLPSLPLPRQMDLTCEQQTPCGLTHMARMLKERGLAGTFFLNVYEYKSWGEPVLRDIATRLQADGHDVALHTHPQWAYDPARPYMYDYSAEDQNRIIADGVRLLQQWTGRPVVAHRAGAYSANRDTIAALARNGILLDSSLFLDHPHSRLNGLGLPANAPSMIGSVLEIPVTVYRRHERPPVIGPLLPAYVAVGKVDVGSIATTQEATAALDALVAADLPFIVVFLHSFSFMQEPATGQWPPRADVKALQVYGTLLDRIVAQQLPVATSRQIAANRAAVALPARDTVPPVALTVPAHKYAIRMLRSRPIASALMIGFLVVAAAAAFWALTRRRLQPAHSSS